MAGRAPPRLLARARYWHGRQQNAGVGRSQRIDKAGHLIFPDGQNRGRGSGALDRGQFDREEEVLWPDGCAAMYRKEMLDEIGGFDEDFFAYGDDAELGLRARIAGWNASIRRRRWCGITAVPRSARTRCGAWS
jgi:GT2 family glycosyltransferase